jgi:hypothetical protein
VRFPGAEYCSICGGPATGAWHPASGAALACCGACAVETLPKLIADSIDLPPNCEEDAAKRALFHVESGFWKALFHRMARERRGNA